MQLRLAPAALLLPALAIPHPCAAQDANALARAGTEAIESRRFGDALHAFTRAATMRPDDANLCFGAGVAAFMLGQDGVAQNRFECALAVNPTHRSALTWLGDLHYRAGRLSTAIAVYETARAADPQLQHQLETWRKEYELERRFHEVRTTHFTARFELAGDEAGAHEILDRLEAASLRIGNALGIHPSRSITVVLYNLEQFRDVTKLADWSAAGYDGRIRLPLAGALNTPEELDRVLSHELAHAIVATIGGRFVPAWLNEGFATVLEPAGSTDTEALLGDARFTLHDTFSGLSRRDAEIAYASAARAVRALIEERGLTAVVALLEDLGQGVEFARAFKRRMGIGLNEFASGLRGRVRQSKLVKHDSASQDDRSTRSHGAAHGPDRYVDPRRN